MQAAGAEHDAQRAEAMRAAGRDAEDRALELDPRNSEALAHKAYLIDQRDWVAQEALFKSAIAAKPLDCGCEHYGYGLKLASVGRLAAAADQFRAATDMLALWSDSQLALAEMLVATGRGEQSHSYFDAAINLSKDPHFDKRVAINAGVETGNYAAAIDALRDPQVAIPSDSRAALLAGYEALTSGAPPAKMRAVQAMLLLPKDRQDDTLVAMLAALGANREALQIGAEKPWLFWRRSMRGVLDEPAFPAIAKRAGLLTYWKTTRTKPDICAGGDQPAFCRMI
jgi:hypothetical protein